MITHQVIIDKNIKIVSDNNESTVLNNTSPLLDSLKNILTVYDTSLKILVIDVRIDFYKELADAMTKPDEDPWSWCQSNNFAIHKDNIKNITDALEIKNQDYDFVVFDLSWDFVNYQFSKFFISSIKKNISENTKVILVSNGPNEKKIDSFYYTDNFFEVYSFKKFKDLSPANRSINNKNKKFISLNRKPRPLRLEFVKSLYENDLDKHFLLSHPAFENYQEKILDLSLDLFYLDNEKIKNISLNDINNAIAEDDYFININSDLFNKSFFNAVTESIVSYRDKVYITEKTFKPIYYKTPFIVFGQYQILNSLRQMGYMTYHPYIDETYDNEENDLNRLELIIKEIKRICDLPEKDFLNLYHQCCVIAGFNHKNFLKRNESCIMGKKFIDYLYNLCYNEKKEKNDS